LAKSSGSVVVRLDNSSRRPAWAWSPCERLRGGAFDRSRQPRLGARGGSTLGTAVAAEANVEALASAYRQP
jgi:hypothetical protein